jgi:hypothetical protein
MTKQPDIGNNNCIQKRYLEIIISRVFLPNYVIFKKIKFLVWAAPSMATPLSLVA